jgi:O-antigen/teichoic acid export membrane protein
VVGSKRLNFIAIMGIIQRQSIKYSAINFIGTLIGGLSILFLYPLDDALYGYANMLISMAYLLIPFASFGIGSVVIRFFREFKNESDNNGFLLFTLAITLATNLFFLLLYFIFKDAFYNMISFLKMDVNLLQENELVILFLVFLINLLSLFTAYISNYRRIVIPTLVQNLGYKIWLPIIFAFCYFGFISQSYFSFLIPLFYVISILILIYYLIKLGGWNLSWKPSFYKSKYKEVTKYLGYTGLTSLGSSLTFRLDSVMVSLMISLTSNGLYNKIYFMANTINIPYNSVTSIANPIISESIEDNNINHVEEIYKKSSTNLFLVGSYLYIIMIFCLPSLFQLSTRPDSFQGGLLIFIFLGAGKVFDLITSVNSAIIGFSKYYKYNLIFILLLGISNIFLNYFLIGKYGVIGAAAATMIALALFNIMKLLFIYIKFKIHPFSTSSLKIITLFGSIYFLLYFIDFQANPYYTILINGLVITVLAFFIAYKWNISPEANQYLDENLSKWKMK